MNQNITSLIVAAAILTAPTVAEAKIDIYQLGDANTMVRISEPRRYLLLPVQESMPDAKIDILVNGNTASTIYVRLADSNIDYTVPLDLTPYTSKGDVVLNIVSEVNRTHSRSAREFAAWESMALADTFALADTEKYRPVFHHTPPYGWMNDPNGMFWKDGRWHLYYQHNPYGSKWQNMSWGHSSSTDLVNWEHHPLALVPDGLGSVFSGSAVIDSANTAGLGDDAVIAIYTSAGVSQVQSLASSNDSGMTFTPYPGNPIIPNPREARDPNMFWHEPTRRWVMVLADATEQQMQIYTSPDLLEWTLRSSFGKGYGSQFGVWECPDLFELPVEGTGKTKWVLVCNINPGGPAGGSATQYFTGDFDGERFICDSPAHLSKWMDYGKDHYATVSWSNAPEGRRTVIGWMSNWQYANDVPTMQFRSANTLPRDLGLFRGRDGETYLSVKPSPETDAMRGTPEIYGAATIGAEPVSYRLPKDNDGICEIVIDYNAKGCRTLDLVLSNEAGERVAMAIDPENSEFAMDRTQSGMVKFSRHFPTVTRAPMHKKNGRGTLRIFIDRCSLEAFDGDGRFAMTNLVFPDSPYTSLTVSADGGRAHINSVSVYPLQTLQTQQSETNK